MFSHLFSFWRTRTQRKSRVPEGRRVYAIGDIHGRLDLLEALHDQIAEDVATAPERTKTIVYLGDYIDRGLDSRGVIECLVGAPLEQVTPVFLLGNHEETLLRFLDDFMVGESWLAFGGDATLYSYGVQLDGLSREQRTMIEAQLNLRENMPEAHLAFLRGLESHHRIGDYFFAHAGIRPGVPLDKQTTEDLIWIRDVFLKSTADHGAVVVHGHSISLDAEDLPNRINIDTGAYATNVLTCLVLEGADHWLLQTG
ncbi:MAG: metallophosphoesterase [Proteobacteria bacterium]|nr:metallophosphoesterase [Pseudomonadota bacterium]